MAHFASYNSDDPTANQAAPGANGVVTLGPIQTDIAAKIAGSVFADQSGATCVVQQSFDGGQHWDISDSISLTANQGSKIFLDVVAPVVQVVFTNGANAQNHLRIFVRIFGNRASG
jgi:hypothetical protein